MQLESLYYLLAIEQSGSTRKAAEQLNTSYQNVSRVLLQMEEEWNVVLFQRSSKGMLPTDEGKLAIASAREMLRVYNHMLEQFQLRMECLQSEQDGRFSGKLDLVSSVVVNNGFINDLLLEFSDQYPRIQVNLMEEDAYLPNSEREGRLSLVPRMTGDISCSKNQVYPLLKDKIVMLVRKDSPLNTQKSISLKRMAKLPLVLVTKNHWEESIFGHMLQVHKVTLEKPIFTGSVIGFQKYIASGKYAGLSTEIISLKLMGDKRHNFNIVSIRDKDMIIYHCLVIQDIENLTPEEQCFVDFVKDSFHIT